VTQAPPHLFEFAIANRTYDTKNARHNPAPA
jgi:hypothetical protein